MLGFNLMRMLWERDDFIGSRFPPEVCEKMAKSVQLISSLDLADHIAGMTASEFSVVCCAVDYSRRHNDMTAAVAEIAAEMCVSVPAVSRTLRSLQKKGYIIRQADENDRRSVRVTVTPAGEKILEKNLGTFTADLNCLLSVFSEDEMRMIAELYSKLAGALGQLKASNERSI